MTITLTEAQSRLADIVQSLQQSGVIIVADDGTPLARLTPPETVTGSGWPEGYFEETYGSLADDPLERLPQGEFPKREPIS